MVLNTVYDKEEGAVHHKTKRIHSGISENKKVRTTPRACLRAFQWVLQNGARVLVNNHGCPKHLIDVVENVWFEYLTRFTEVCK